jgi:DNA-binding CsgD family transcriptional regulator
MTGTLPAATIPPVMFERPAEAGWQPKERPLRPLRAVPPVATPPSDAIAPCALGDLVVAPAAEVATRARAVLAPLLAHDALVVVTPASPSFPVHIAAPRGLREGLAVVDWVRMVDAAAVADGAVARIPVGKLEGALDLACWAARSGRSTVVLVAVAQGRLDISAAAEHAAMLVTMVAAARARGVDRDPPPGTLAFSLALSQERERTRAELNTRHAATLARVLQTLRSATWAGGSRRAPREVTEAIDVSSRALLDLEAHEEVHDESGRVPVSAAFAETAGEARGIVQAAGLRVLADLQGDDDAQVPRAIAQAARIVTTACALRAARRPGADRLRILWRLEDAALGVTVADNGSALSAAELRGALADIKRRLGGLEADLDLDSRDQWATTLTCRLSLHDTAVVTDTPAEKRLAELRDREREVLELMISGLRNREIGDRLVIGERTVKFHVSNILQKLGVESRTAAIALAYKAGVSASPAEPGSPAPRPAVLV